MAQPAVHATTQALYDRLPGFYRDADSKAPGVGDWPLLRYLSLIGDQLGEIEDLFARIEYVAPDDGGDPTDTLENTSDLADPTTADIAWLPWMGQHVGVQVSSALTDQEKRDAVKFASSGWRAATRSAVEDAAKTVLTGTKYVRVYDHATTRADAGTATQWDILIVTRPSETPDVQAVLDTVVAKGAKPAGVVLHHEAYDASWATLEASRPTWADWNDVAWRDIEETI